MRNKTTDYRLQTTVKKIFSNSVLAVDGRQWSVDFKKGFTLMELLVAITILGVVFGFIISSSAAINRRSRDQQRINDMQTIQAALQQYYADNHFYPRSLPGGGSFNPNLPGALTECTGNPAACPPGPKTYLSRVPNEVVTAPSPPYCYIAHPSLSSFTSNPNPNPRACDNSTTPCQYYSLYMAQESSSNPFNLSCLTLLNAYNYVIHPI